MAEYSMEISVPVVLDKAVVWPVLLLRLILYGYSFRRVRLIPDKYAIVEPRDFHEVSKYTWWAKKTPRSYTAVRFEAKGRILVPVHMHREIMLKKLKPESGELPAKLFVDHKNRNGIDNRRANLRMATQSQNCMNRCAKRGTSSKYKGVSWYRAKNCWRAMIQVRKKNIALGYFDCEEEAARAYDAAAKRYHGEYAYLNFGANEGALKLRARLKKIIRSWLQFGRPVLSCFFSRAS